MVNLDTTTDDWQGELNALLPPFRSSQYELALPGFEAFIAKPSCPDLYLLRARRNIADCLIGMYVAGKPLPDWDTRYRQNLEAYLQLAERIDVHQVAPTPILGLFDDGLRVLAITEPLDKLAVSAGTLFQRFFAASQGKVQRDELFRVAVGAVECERRNFEIADHALRAERLAEGIVQVFEVGELPSYRAALTNLMADLAYFFPRSTEDEQQRYQRVLGYLELSLQAQPSDAYARSMKNHVQRLATTTLQIKRFGHDTRNRLGNIRHLIKALEQSTLDEHQSSTVVNLRREFQELVLVQNLVEGRQPSSDQWESVDPGGLILGKLQQFGWPAESLIREGEPATWEICPELVGLALGNVLRNTAEAYQRRSLPVPHIPAIVTLDYTRRQIRIRDFAGGIDPSLGDIFAPFVSSKPVRGNTGLGLTQAHEAIAVQSPRFRLYLSDPQPADGAQFVFEFPELE